MIKLLREKWLPHLGILAGAVHIRIKILGIVLALVLMLGLTVIIEVQQLVTQNMYAQLEEQAVSITRDLAARSTDSILINDLYTLQQLLKDTRTNHPDVRYAFVVSPEGYVLAHTFENGFPQGLSLANSASREVYQHTQILLTDQGKIWDIAVPIFEGRAGTARVGLSDREVQETLNTLTGQLVLTTVIVSVIGIAAATFLTWLLTRPILSLVQATKAVERGDFSQRVPSGTGDEIGELAGAFNAMAGALARSEAERVERDQLRLQYVSGVITAQEDERKRIARELHDSTSQSLTSLLIGLKTLDDTSDHSEIHKRASELRAIAGNTLDDVHALALQLRPSVLDDLGLPEALARQVEDCQRRHPLKIDLAITGLDGQRLPAEIETALYRITQEALTNIVRHAGADTASIFIERNDERVLAVIEDDGHGFDASSIDKRAGHLGLYGIRERAELLSGQLVIESATGQGTSLYVDIPLAGGMR
ncbi:MAG TPA: HAMP domain-containing protein [Chloroflexia bacterium]|nr:HAMP domain-containing protein [Chloroflexia bacterium]